MEKAIKNLEESARNVDNRLDSLTWKFEEFEKGVLNIVKNKPKKVTVSIMELIQDIENVRKDYNKLNDEIRSIEEAQKELSLSVTQEINTVHHNFVSLQKAMKPFK